MERKVIYILLFICLITNAAYGQNIVFNGSFEIRDSVFQGSYNRYYSCPYTQGDEFEMYYTAVSDIRIEGL